jgi:RNA polymerase sigma-70 factor (ECF subfamily)
VVQESLLKAHEHFHQFVGISAEELAAWLRRILTNTLMDTLRRVTREQSIFVAMEQSSAHLEEWLAASGSSPSERVMRQDRLEELARVLEQLPEDQRTAVQLLQIHDYSVKDIAKSMGRTKEAVGGLLKRGMRRLRELMQD